MPDPSSTVDLLRRGMARIADPAHWTKGWSARSSAGVLTAATADNAVCWCASGALRVESETEPNADADSPYWAALRALNRAVPAKHKCGAVRFNDLPSTRHEDVMGLFRRAIAAEEAA